VANATGIGPALRKARLLRGKSIEEASRETRIRAEYIQALERERFDSLLGDVYARGFLRSYSSYLGLDSEKVVSIYTQHFGLPARPAAGPAPAPAPGASPPRGRRPSRGPARLLRRSRRSPWLRRRGLNWPVLVVLAAAAVVGLAAAGLFSRAKVAPPPATPATQAAGVSTAQPGVTVSVLTTERVGMVVLSDGRKVFDRVLLAGEGQDFTGQHVVEVRLAHGGTVTLVVNGHTIASPGSANKPYDASFGPNAYRSQPSAAPSAR